MAGEGDNVLIGSGFFQEDGKFSASLTTARNTNFLYNAATKKTYPKKR